MLKQVESLTETPEQLLKSLEAELSWRRGRRETSQSKRVAVISIGLLLILLGTTVALCALFSTLNGLPHGRMASETVSEPVPAP